MYRFTQQHPCYWLDPDTDEDCVVLLTISGEYSPPQPNCRDSDWDFYGYIEVTHLDVQPLNPDGSPITDLALLTRATNHFNDAAQLNRLAAKYIDQGPLV